VNAAEERPLLLVLDDLQWADAASLRWAGFLARRLDGPDIALLATIRSGESGAPERLLDDLRAAPRARRLTPAAFSPAATATLVREHDPLAADSACAACHEATGGNPLLVAEVLGAMDRGEDGLRAAAAGISGGVRRRIERADPAALRVARAAAVLGEDATLGHVLAIAELDPLEAGRAATALSAAAVFKGPEPYAFTHPLVQSAVLEAIDDGELAELHRAAARLLAAEGALTERVVAHLLATPGTGDEGTLELLLRAAETALTRGAPRSAIPVLERALAEPPAPRARGAVLSRLGSAERLAGDRAAIEHLSAAHALAADPGERALLARQVAGAQYDLSHYEDAARTLSDALREAPENLDAPTRDALRIDLLTVALLVSNLDRTQLLSDLGRGTEPTEPEVLAAIRVAALGIELGEMDAVGTIAGEFEQLLANHPPTPERLDMHTSMWFALQACERFEGLREQLDLVEGQTGAGWMRGQFAINLVRGQLEHRLGNLDAAASAHEANLEFGVDNETGVQFALAGLASACLDRGETERAAQLLESVQVPPNMHELHLAWVHWAIARVAVATGDDEAAAQSFATGCAITRGFPGDVDVLWEEAGGERIACLRRLGRTEEARDDVERALSTARKAQLVGLEGIALRLRGVADGDEACLEEAVACLDRTPLRLEQARALCELGAHRRRSGQRRTAREPLRRALGLAHACGAQPLADRAREELLLAGARPRRDALTGRDALTPAELRVARLAAAGCSNREIAQRLFITVKTVEGHLARTFRKLELHQRGDLATALDGSDAGLHQPSR
jgi:DNA-binding CsgD family transcriptional regulator